ncbi:LOW QUALITY PROTEIN: hypothetical protein V2J09_018683 [Rumex salicifolius]
MVSRKNGKLPSLSILCSGNTRLGSDMADLTQMGSDERVGSEGLRTRNLPSQGSMWRHIWWSRILMGLMGNLSFSIDQEVLDAMAGLWKNNIVAKVLGRSFSLPTIERKLRDMWKPAGSMNIIDLPRKRIYQSTHWWSGEDLRILSIDAWSPDFNPLSDVISTTPVWIRLANIPMIYYHKAILLGIAAGIGNPVKVDMSTTNLERGRFARICIEVDLKLPLKGRVYGHLAAACPSRVKNTDAPVETPAIDPKGKQIASAGPEGQVNKDVGMSVPENEAHAANIEPLISD